MPAEAHQEQLHTAHGGVRARPPGDHAGVVDAAGTRRCEGLALDKPRTALAFGRAPVPDGTHMGPGDGRVLEAFQVLRGAGFQFQLIEGVQQFAGVDQGGLGLFAQTLREFGQALFLGDHGLLRQEPGQGGERQQDAEQGRGRDREQDLVASVDHIHQGLGSNGS